LLINIKASYSTEVSALIIFKALILASILSINTLVTGDAAWYYFSVTLLKTISFLVDVVASFLQLPIKMRQHTDSIW
jgi:hypothetical protein